MTSKSHYKRVLVKLSGEAMSGTGGFGVSCEAMDALVAELVPVVKQGVEVALVVGGGNLRRGRDLSDNPHIQRTTADSMGMLATVMNAIALRDTLISHCLPAAAMSATQMTPVCEHFMRSRAVEYLEQGKVVVLAGGTGNPYFTTDTCAALRALEIGADVLIKATKVDGVYDRDPMVDQQAKKYDSLTYDKVLADRLGVMDLTAISLCMENALPIIVFELLKSGNLLRAVQGKKVGTMVCL